MNTRIQKAIRNDYSLERDAYLSIISAAVTELDTLRQVLHEYGFAMDHLFHE